MSYAKQTIDVAKRIDEINNNIDYTKLRESYKRQTIFEIIGKGRNETTHSSLLAWLFAGKDLPVMGTESPIIKLLDILIHRIGEQHPDWYKESVFNDFKIAVRSRYLTVDKINAVTEKNVLDLAREVKKYPHQIGDVRISTEKELINQLDPGKKKGKKDSIDIYLSCDVSGINATLKHIEVFIENKIGSSEGGPKTNAVTEYEKMSQTQRYYWACRRDHCEDTLQLFVYLNACSSSDLHLSSDEHPDNARNPRAWCAACDHYVSINYQDIYDSIISPLLDSDRLSQQSEYLLSEYARSLSIPVIGPDSSEDGEQIDFDTMSILATGPEERRKLFGFWNENQDIILASLQVAEERDCLTPHIWTRAFLKSDPEHFLSPDTVSQWVKERYVRECENNHEIIKAEKIRNHFNSLNAIKRLGKLNIIREDGRVDCDRVKNAYSQLKSLATQGLLYGTSCERCFDAVNSASQENEILEVYNTFRQNYPFVDKEELILERLSRIDFEYSSISDNEALHNYSKEIVEITFDNEDEESKELLYRFWKRYQKIVMAAILILSETDDISQDDRKAIKQVFDGVSSSVSGRTYYTLKFSDNTEINSLSMLGIVRAIAQNIIWDNHQGQPSCKKANAFFQKVLDDKTEFVKKADGRLSASYDILPNPKGTNVVSPFAYYTQKWTSDNNFGLLYKVLSEPDNKYGMTIIQERQK